MKAIFVYNPESGSGKIEKHKEYILNKLRAKYGQVDVKKTTHVGEAGEIAADSIGKYDYLFVAGGDGTLNEIVNGLKEAVNRPIVGYIPCGTVNDVAHSLGIPKDIRKAVKILVNGQPFAHDIFKVNDRYGIYVCCTGLFTSSSYDTKRKSKKTFGKLAYFAHGAKEVFNAKPVNIKITENGNTWSLPASLLLIINSRSTAGFMLNRHAVLNDGYVELLAFYSHEEKVRLGDVMRCAKVFLNGVGSVMKDKKVIYLKVNEFTLETDGGTIINLDGEKSGEGSFEFRVLPRGIDILLSPNMRKKLEKNAQKY